MASATGARSWIARVARIRYRLLLINVIAAAVPLVGIGFARMHEAQLLGALEQDMVHQAQLVRAPLPAIAADGRERMLAAAARDTRTRIRLLDAAGAVI